MAFYTVRITFLLDQLFTRPRITGRDLPKDHRICAICLETIEEDSLAVSNCLVAPGTHNYHLLCQFKWLSIWPSTNSDGPNRICPSCRTALYTQTPSVVPRPHQDILKRWADIDEAWQDLLSTAMERFAPSRNGWGYIDPRIANRAIMNEDVEGANLIGLLTNRPQVEFLRASNYLSEEDNEGVDPDADLAREKLELDKHLDYVKELRAILDRTCGIPTRRHSTRRRQRPREWWRVEQ